MLIQDESVLWGLLFKWARTELIKQRQRLCVNTLFLPQFEETRQAQLMLEDDHAKSMSAHWRLNLRQTDESLISSTDQGTVHLEWDMIKSVYVFQG